MASSEQESSQSRYVQAAADFAANDNFPAHLVCPITQTLMTNPVLTIQGNVYERAAITEWLQSHRTDPVTNAVLTARTLIPCNPVKSECEAFKAAVRQHHPEAALRLPVDPLPASRPVVHANPVSFLPYPQPLKTRTRAAAAALQCGGQVSSFRSIIGTYLGSKLQSANLKTRQTPDYLEYAYSAHKIFVYNHVMHKLEQLSAHVLRKRPDFRVPWCQAVNPFRRQLFSSLYLDNRFIKTFAGGLPIELPTMDNWTLGMYASNSIHASPQMPGRNIDRSRPLLSQVHTALLIDTSHSMTKQGTAHWGTGHDNGTSCLWDQVCDAVCDLALIIAQYDPQGIDIHISGHSFIGLRSAQEVQAWLHKVKPSDPAPLGLCINTVLDAYMATLRYDQKLKPLNLVVITSSGASDKLRRDKQILWFAVTEHVVRIKQRGFPAHQLGLEILQVGDCQSATRDLLELQEYVSKDHRNFNHGAVRVTPTGYEAQRIDGSTLANMILTGIKARVNT